MNDSPRPLSPVQPGLCPYCGHGELDFHSGAGEFTATAANKRVRCPACGREHQLQYRAAGMRIYEPQGDSPVTRDVALAPAPTCLADCRLRGLITAVHARVPGLVYGLIAAHLALFFSLPWIEDTWDMSQIFGLSWFAIMHVQVALLGAWVGAGGPRITLRACVAFVFATATLFLLSLAADGDFDDFVPWLLPEVFASAGLFALADRGGYRFWMADRDQPAPSDVKLQFSILQLLGAMTLLSVLAGGVSIVFWLAGRQAGNDEFLLSVAYAVLNSLAIFAVCWAVLAPAHVLLRALLAFGLIQVMALTLVYGADEWQWDVAVVVCSTAAIVFSATAATFAVLRTAGYRFSRRRIAPTTGHAAAADSPPSAG